MTPPAGGGAAARQAALPLVRRRRLDAVTVAAVLPAPARSRAPPPGGRGAAPLVPHRKSSPKACSGSTAPTTRLAVEMADHVVLFEPGPQNLARARAIITETKRLFPTKPIRYGVISHHHLDHTQGLAEAVAEGITIVTPAVNRAYLTSAMSAPRTLAPDALAKSGKKPQIEGFTGDKRVFQDGTRTFEIHVIKGLPHADGLVIGWLPKEKLLVYADMFNLPTDGERPGSESSGRRHAGVRGEHGAAEPRCGAHHVGPQSESGSTHVERGAVEVARTIGCELGIGRWESRDLLHNSVAHD